MPSTPRRAASARASTARRAPCAARPCSPTTSRCCARASTRASASCDNGTVSGPALDVAAEVAQVAAPGEILATSTVQDLVAGSGIFFADNSGTAGELRLFSVLR